MERYLYFTNPDDTGAPNDNGELAMYPTSAVTCFFASTATRTTINFVPRDGADNTAGEDTIVLIHAEDDHKNVMSELVAMINAEKNNSPFQVVSDKEKSVFNITGVTGCIITSAD